MLMEVTDTLIQTTLLKSLTKELTTSPFRDIFSPNQ